MSADRIREQLAANLAAFDVREVSETALKRAAVCVIAGPHEDSAAILLTRRATSLRGHAGQWAFPGGRLDPGETPLQAAIREAHEEVGLELADVHLLGRLDDYETRSGYAITPFVFWHDMQKLVPNPDEVASLHPIPLDHIGEGRVPEFLPGPDPQRPILRLHLGAHQVHAPTAAVLHQFHEVAVLGRGTRVAHFDQPDWAR